MEEEIKPDKIVVRIADEDQPTSVDRETTHSHRLFERITEEMTKQDRDSLAAFLHILYSEIQNHGSSRAIETLYDAIEGIFRASNSFDDACREFVKAADSK